MGIPQEPRDVAYGEIRQIVKETYNIVPGGIEYLEAVKKACQRNTLVMDYLVKDDKSLVDSLDQGANFKLRPIAELLRKDPHIVIVGEKPMVMKWDPNGNFGHTRTENTYLMYLMYLRSVFQTPPKINLNQKNSHLNH